MNITQVYGAEVESIGRMAELADATALGAVGATLGGSNPLPPIRPDGKLRDPEVSFKERVGLREGKTPFPFRKRTGFGKGKLRVPFPTEEGGSEWGNPSAEEGEPRESRRRRDDR